MISEWSASSMEVVSPVESDAGNSTSSNAWFAHLMLAPASSPAFSNANINNNCNLERKNSSISTQPNDPAEDDDEFGEFEFVPAQSSNNIPGADPPTNGDKQLAFGFENGFGDFQSNNGSERFPSPPQEVSGFSFSFPDSHATVDVLPDPELLGQNTPFFGFSSKFETLDRNKVTVQEQIPHRDAFARPIEGLDNNISATAGQSSVENDAARSDHAEIRVPVESDGTGTEDAFDEDWGDFVETPSKEFWQHSIGAFGEHQISSADRKPEVSTDFAFDSGPFVEPDNNCSDGSLDLFANFNNVESFRLGTGNGALDRSAGNGITASSATGPGSNSTDVATNGHGIAHPVDGRHRRQNSAVESISRPLPLSLFGEEEPDCKTDSDEKSVVNLFDDPLGFRHDFDGRKGSVNFQPVSNAGLQFNDFIETLYRQAEKDSSLVLANGDKGGFVIEKEGGVASGILVERDGSIVDGNNLVDTVSDTGAIFEADSNEDFDSSDWEFKDAFSEFKSGVRNFGFNPECVTDDGEQFTDSSVPDNDELMDLVAFYTKLKGESHLFALDHLSALEGALSIATESNNVDKAEAVGKDIRAAMEKLAEANDLLEQHETKEDRLKNASVEEMLAELHHSYLLAFESEFHLAELISLAKEDLKAAVDLYQHAVSVLCILASASIQEQSAYLSVWNTMTAACAAELQHGANIWNQALDADVHTHILAHPRGRGYFGSLGEVFRVLEVLKASMKFYRPWILLNSDKAKRIMQDLKNCTAVWIESGLREVVCRTLATDDCSDTIHLASWKTIEQLTKTVESMEQMHLVNALHAAVRKNEPVCRLSLLPISVFDGLKGVEWGGQHFFLLLANLWANCVSCKPPQLPLLRV